MSSLGLYYDYVFQGGTCIRFFYDSPRFSSDLDFTALNPIRMGENVSKIVKKVQELALPLGFSINSYRESLQRFYLTIDSEKCEKITIKIEF